MTVTLTLEQALAHPCDHEYIESRLEHGRAYTVREMADAGVPLSNLLSMIQKLARDDPALTRMMRHLSADYMEHPIGNGIMGPIDSRDNTFILALRDFADGITSSKAFTVAREAAFYDGDDTDSGYYAYMAACAVAYFSGAPARDAEREWQLNRLLERLEEVR